MRYADPLAQAKIDRLLAIIEESQAEIDRLLAIIEELEAKLDRLEFEIESRNQHEYEYGCDGG